MEMLALNLRTRSGAIFAILFFAILLPVIPASAQSDDVLRIDTDLAAFEITVTDKDGNPVRNLDSKDFRVIEDGMPRQIDFFQPIKKEDPTRPLSVVFALDVSGSMTPQELERLRSAMDTFIKKLADYNSYFAITAFGMDVMTLQGFTNRPDKLERTFAKLERDADGLSTHAYDAVDDAIRMLRKKSPPTLKGRLPKRAVIVVTDGFPVGDVVSPKTVIERANAFETSIYSVILPSFSRLQKSDKPLLTPLEASGLIEKTGGKSFYATAKNFDDLFKSLAEEITSSYAVAFYPSEENRNDGKFHSVKIETSKDYVIRQNRAGYQMKR
jgi:VWFA-related protein